MFKRSLAFAASVLAIAIIGFGAFTFGQSLSGQHTASCDSTAVSAQTHCLSGLTPIDRTAAFFPLEQRYTVRVAGEHGVQRVPVTLY